MSIFGSIASLAVGGGAGALGFAVGGPVGALIGFGLGSSMASRFFGDTIKPTDAATAIGRNAINQRDAEAPRQLWYGLCLGGGTIVYSDVVGRSLDIDVLDIVLGSHPSEELLGVVVNSDWLPVVTSSVEGIRAVNQFQEQPNLPETNPAGGSYWHTVQSVSKYYRRDQSKSSGSDKWHVCLRWYLGGQTAPDADMAKPQGTGSGQFEGGNPEYANKFRLYYNLTKVHVIQRANSVLFQGTQIANYQFLMKGKNDIWDPRGGSGYTAWTRNAVLVIVDYMITRLGYDRTDFDEANLIEQADKCDQTGWTSPNPPSGLPAWDAGAQGRYWIDGIVDWSEDPGSVLDDMLTACQAVMYKGDGGKTMFRVGVSWPDSGITLTQDDWLDTIELRKRRPYAERMNSLNVHYVRQVVESEGNDIPGWQPAPLAQIPGDLDPALRDAWRAEDNGILESDLRLRFCTLDLRAQYIGWVALQRDRTLSLDTTMAGESVLSGWVNMRALPLTEGDIVRVADLELWGTGTEHRFQVVAKQEDFANQRIHLTLRFWDTDAFVIGATKRDLKSKLPAIWHGQVPDVTGLTATQIPRTSAINPETSTARVQVEISWDDVENAYVVAGGGYQLQMRRGGTTPWTDVPVYGTTTRVVVTLQIGQGYDFQIRAFTATGSHSEAWTAMSFTPVDDTLLTPAPPTDARFGDNVLSNPVFDQADVQTNTVVGWDLVDNNHVGNGSATVVATTDPSDGAIGAHRIDLVVDGDNYDVVHDTHIPASAGQVYRCRSTVRLLSTPGFDGHQLAVKALFYDNQRMLLSGEEFDILRFDESEWPAAQTKYRIRTFQVPENTAITYMRIEHKGRWPGAGSSPATWALYGGYLKPVQVLTGKRTDFAPPLQLTFAEQDVDVLRMSLASTSDQGFVALPGDAQYKLRAFTRIKVDATGVNVGTSAWITLRIYAQNIDDPNDRVELFKDRILDFNTATATLRDVALTPGFISITTEADVDVPSGAKYEFWLTLNQAQGTNMESWIETAQLTCELPGANLLSFESSAGAV